MVSRSDPGSFQRTTTCIWMPDVRLLHYFEPTQRRSVSGLDDGKRKTKRGWSPGDSLNLVRVLSVRVNYSQQCRNDINGRWEYSKSIMATFSQTIQCTLYFQMQFREWKVFLLPCAPAKSKWTHLLYASLNRASIGSDNSLSPIRRQAII